jgi:hypothetical protein
MKIAKTVVAAVLAGAASLNVALGDNGFSTTDAVTVALAVLTALGVYAVPNKK